MASRKRSGEGRLVPHPVGIGTDRHEKQVDVAQLGMGQPVGALGQDGCDRPAEHQRELAALLALGSWSAEHGALGGLGELQSNLHPVARARLERLADPSAEMVESQPVDRPPADTIPMHRISGSTMTETTRTPPVGLLRAGAVGAALAPAASLVSARDASAAPASTTPRLYNRPRFIPLLRKRFTLSHGSDLFE